MNWRNDPITEKQRDCIETMHEFSCYPIPLFRGTTKGVALSIKEKVLALKGEKQ